MTNSLSTIPINRLNSNELDEKINISVEEKADIDLSNLSTVGQEILDNKLNKQMISNCITEIPQDIQLELVDGTLTLKAGSKVYIPRTNNEFLEVIISNDLSYTYSNASVKPKLFYNLTTNSIFSETNTGSGSGTNPPQAYYTYYNTSLNVVRRTIDGSTWLDDELSLPLCNITVIQGTGITSIDQIFNGFGYIGSTVFVLPGVRGLSPNGRNADGTLKNIECVYTSPQTMTLTSSWGTGNEICLINGANLDAHRNSLAFYVSDTRPSSVHLESFWFNPKENQHYYTMDTGASWIPFCAAHAFDISFTSGVVDTLKPKTTFRALDYNDRATIVSWGMPDYSAGVSRSGTWTAECAGIYSIRFGTVTNQEGAFLVNGQQFYGRCRNLEEVQTIWAPIPKGATVTLQVANISAIFYPFMEE